ncbi:ABC transporter permease [Paenibacillus validus]|uniref:ABC transporter permease n=1 Tax=Paenibacillus TaxID=44249 RepID=UPI000FDB063D|nr:MULTISPECIES: ABC transporter permease [Paenibacillus]MED4601322.1 ABC transporter permease [Paenibacillus validus]MED4608047.1 ABC transporter permease [Paenibacillus validus]
MTHLLRAEWSKLRHSKLMWLVLLTPVLISAQGTANFMRYKQIWTRDAWTVLIEQSFIFYSSLMLPLFIAVLMVMMARIEHSHNGWKQCLALPIGRAPFYLMKFAIGVFLTFLSIGMLCVCILLGGFIVQAEGPIPYDRIFLPMLLAFAAAMPIMSIQYWLSVTFAQVGIPLAIAAGLSLPNLLVANSKYWIFDPWTYPMVASLNGTLNQFHGSPAMFSSSLLLFLLSLGAGLIHFRKKDVM